MDRDEELEALLDEEEAIAAEYDNDSFLFWELCWRELD
jgi:hypothetical protein